MGFYENFVKLCNKAGKTPSRVAEEIGISKSIVSRWKNGGGVTDATVLKVATYFDVPAGVLTGDIDPKTFASNLIRHMADSFLTPEEVSEKTGISAEEIREMIEGHIYPSEGDIAKISKAFSIIQEDLTCTWQQPKSGEVYQPVWMDSDTFDIIGKYKYLTPAQKSAVRQVIETFLIGNTGEDSKTFQK